jgi:hypothetical protein
MSNGAFLIVLIALGFAMLLYFNRRSKNYRQRHPGEDNPIDQWLTGKEEQPRENRKKGREDTPDK